MVARNDFTGHELRSRRGKTNKFADEWERLFGKKDEDKKEDAIEKSDTKLDKKVKDKKEAPKKG
jgi:hypothetical protein